MSTRLTSLMYSARCFANRSFHFCASPRAADAAEVGSYRARSGSVRTTPYFALIAAMISCGAQRNAGSFETGLGRHDVGAEQREMRDAGVLFGQIHKDVRCARAGRIQDEVQFQARRVVEDGNGLRPQRPRGLPEAKQLVKRTARPRS
jgi:hypothetical protein